MAEYFQLQGNIVIPIVVICLIGVIFRMFIKMDSVELSAVSFYILAPSLIFIALIQTRLSGKNTLDIIEFTVLQTLACWGGSLLLTKILRFSSKERSAITLTTIFGNANNYGLPVLMLAYGQIGLSNGAVYVIGQVILMNSLGLYIASRSELHAKAAVKKVLKAPLIYAVAIGVMIHEVGWSLPSGILTGLKMLGNAYGAIVLLILGFQLAQVGWKGLLGIRVWAAVGMRVFVVPCLSYVCILILGIHGLLASILLVQSSMPAAVNTIVLSKLYGSDEKLVASTVSITTMISFLSLPLLLIVSKGF